MRFQINGPQLPPHVTNFLQDGDWCNIEKVQETRTKAQNDFIWAVVYPQVQKAFNELGIKHSIDTIHKAFKSIYLPKPKKKRNPISGKYDSEKPTTTKLSKQAFSQYIKDIEEYCMDQLGYTLDLRDLKELKYYDSIIN